MGLVVSISLISPPGYLRLGFIELSDFLILLFSVLLFYDFIKNQDYRNINIKSPQVQLWGLLILILFLSLMMYGFNLLIFRLMFYCILGYLFANFVIKTNLENLEYFIVPFSLVTLLNLVSSVFQLSYVDNTIGWISFFYENPTFFQRGRLSGFQGSGPNVAGGMFAVLTFLNLYFFKELRKTYLIVLAFANLSLVFLSFSRGSYLGIFFSFVIYLLYKQKSLKLTFITSLVLAFSVLGFLFIGDSKILLKESDRGFLTQIAMDNILLFKGLGPGQYIEEIYNDYFLSINPDILEENLNINLNKVELGITPEEYRNSNNEFYIGTSGGGFEILVQSKLVSECAEDRTTCQHVRVKDILLIDFLSAIFQINNTKISNFISNSGCFNEENSNILRGEFYCVIDKLYKDNLYQIQTENIPKNFFFVQCTDNPLTSCDNRELAIGELAVIVEKLSISENIISLENYKTYCSECNFRNTQGFIKMKFDRTEGILPRSVVTFYTSSDSINWDMIGYPRTSGEIIKFNVNSSYLEVGGHSDGQSFGNTFLDAVINEVTISDNRTTQTVKFNKDNLEKDYFVFKPNSLSSYNANITYENNGIKLFRPNKYWLAIENKYDFTNDFEIILKLSLPEIPWERQTLISNTSIMNNQIQSWKLEIDDGRLFLYWANGEGVFIDTNIIGDKSLRSGVLIQQDGKISNTQPPIVDPSFLSQLTTAHNGYLTFSVEFGVLISILFYLIIFYFSFKLFFLEKSNNMFALLAVFMFLFQNLTNDMVYSPDMFILFTISFGFCFQSNNSLEEIKS